VERLIERNGGEELDALMEGDVRGDIAWGCAGRRVCDLGAVAKFRSRTPEVT
jgi:hypothetical protein